MKSPFLISADWGTTKLRLRLIERRSPQWLRIAEASNERGTAALAAEAKSQAAAVLAGDEASRRAELFEQALCEALQTLSTAPEFPDAARHGAPIPIAISGMASSTIGWQLLPQAQLPFAIDGSSLVTHRIARSSLRVESFPAWAGDVLLISGAASTDDSMRGEEVQVVGLFCDPRYDCTQFADQALLLLPGTHCKQIAIRNGAAQSFATYMTGELFALLGEHSILRHSVDPRLALDLAEPDTLAAFREGVTRSAESALTRLFFQVRIAQILHGWSATRCTAFLAGLLIGAELLDGKKLFGAEVPVIVAGNRHLLPQYREALSIVGFLNVTLLSAEQSEDLAVSGHLTLT